MSKVTRFPMTGDVRRKNSLGKFAVPCQVSDRYLQFEEASKGYPGEEWMRLDVMTGGYHGEKPHKICQLVVTRQDLLQALGNVRLR